MCRVRGGPGPGCFPASADAAAPPSPGRPRGPDIGDDRGATATEYAILVAFIAVVIVAGVTVFGQVLSALFVRLASALTDALT